MTPVSGASANLILRTIAAWLVTLLLFFPLGWLVLTAFKTELQAISVPPLLFFTPTLDNFAEVQVRSDYLLYAKNSLITSVEQIVAAHLDLGEIIQRRRGPGAQRLSALRW